MATSGHFRKSSYSGGQGECVETAPLEGGECAVRDSKDPEGPVLRFGAGEWLAFVRSVRAGELSG